jgi:Spy/CpxP family protein refolding chaperone
MKRILIAIISLSLFAGILAAQDQPQTLNPDTWQRPVQARLNLSDAQMKALDELRYDHQKEMIPLRAEIRVKQMEVHEIIAEGKSSKEISKKQEELNKLKAKIADIRNDHLLKVRNIMGEDAFKQMQMMNKGFKNKGRHNSPRGKGFDPYPRGPKGSPRPDGPYQRWF